MLVLPAVSVADSCPNAVFRNGPTSRLPDCRAYEMVTPTYKEVSRQPVGFHGRRLGDVGAEHWGIRGL